MSAGVARERPRRPLPKTLAPATSTSPDRLLDVDEAAAMLGLKSPRTLYKWVYAGRLSSVKIGRLLRFRHSALERLIADGDRPALASPDAFLLTGSPRSR